MHRNLLKSPLAPPQGGQEKLAGLGRTLLALLLFGVSFGYVEAAVVVYVRGLYEPLHQRLHGTTDLFPLIRVDQLQAEGPQYLRWLVTELLREGATLVMLAAVGLAVARTGRQWLAAFLIAFGLWDIFFYVFLKLLIDWPGSPWTWDILFLLPVPWVGPVLAPLLVALTMLGAGVTVLVREAIGLPLRLTRWHWSGISLGALILVVAFCWDHGNTAAGGEPNPFHWPLFAVGEGLSTTAFLHALRASGMRRRSILPLGPPVYSETP